MNTTRHKLRALLIATVLCFGLTRLSYALVTDANSGTSSDSNAEQSVIESTGILPGTPGVTGPAGQDTTDTATAGLGLTPQHEVYSYYSMFFAAAYLLFEECVYADVWGGNGKSWGGGTVGTPIGRFATFFGRPYTGVAGGVGQPIGGGAGITSGGDASASTMLTGIQNGASGAYLGTMTNDPAGFFGHALYDSRTLAPRNLIDLLYAVPVTDKFYLGLAYAYAKNNNEESWSENRPGATPSTLNDGSINNERKTTDHQLNFSALVKDIGSVEVLDFAVNISRISVDNKHNETRLLANGNAAATQASSLESDGAGSIGFITRAVVKCPMKEGNKLVTAFGYSRPNVSSKGTMRLDSDGSGQTNNVAADIDRTWETSDKANNMKLDLAYHHMHNAASRIIFFMSYIRNTSEREFKVNENNPLSLGVAGLRDKEVREETVMGLPIGIAVEHQTWSKVATRLGIKKVLFGKNKVEITDSTNRVAAGALVLDQTSKRSSSYDSSVAPTVSMGLGIKPHKDLDIDLALVSNVFDLDSGAGVADLISRASLIYHF